MRTTPESQVSSNETGQSDGRTSAEPIESLCAIAGTSRHVPVAASPHGLDSIATLVYAATHDALTGLPNRGVLLDRLARELARKDGGDRQVAVLFVDLDNFKLVNDSLGHDSGDEVLREMSRRIRACTRNGDTVSRFGGDELVVLHPRAGNGSEDLLGERILAEMIRPIHVAGREVVVSASVGVAICAYGAEPAEQLLREADTALYAAKNRGRARMARFSEELHARIVRRVQLESDLRTALRAAQLHVDYQPQVDLGTGRLVGVEALARWRHPERGMVSPTDFIPVAEDCRLIGELGRQVLRTACGQLTRWRRASPANRFTLTVNVSPQQIEASGFVDELGATLDETGIHPESLCLELTESALVNPEADMVAALKRIRAMGIYLAIDDFGTQHSSLARLRGLPVEVLKIDRSFIDGLSTEPEDTAIVSSILSLAFAMGKHVIAEGVERPEQAAALHSMGCTVAQGYLLARPWRRRRSCRCSAARCGNRRRCAKCQRPSCSVASSSGEGIVRSSTNFSTTLARRWARRCRRSSSWHDRPRHRPR